VSLVILKTKAPGYWHGHTVAIPWFSLVTPIYKQSRMIPLLASDMAS
jgi:hypothetical protein